MKARGNIQSRLLRRDAPAGAREYAIKFDRFDAVEIFKKTPSIADSQPAGRDVAKDLFEVVGIPVLVTTQLAAGESAARRTRGKPFEAKCGSGAIRETTRQVGPAVNVAISRWDGAEEKQRYADI